MLMSENEKKINEIYEAVNIIGKELFRLSGQLNRMHEEVSSLKAAIKGSSALPDDKEDKTSFISNLPIVDVSPARQEAAPTVPYTSNKEGCIVRGAEPEKKADPARLRTGSFKPGDERIDINNVFYCGGGKSVTRK